MYKASKLAAGSVIAATAALGGASVALADGYSSPRVAYERPADWSGVYFGVGSGYDWSTVDVHQVPTTAFGGAFGSANPGIGISSSNDTGFVSAHLGIQHQFGAVVLGVEGGWMSTLRGNDGSKEFCDSVPASLSTPILAPGNFCSGSLNDILTLGARAGYAMGRWMPYVTGGYANASVDFETRIPGTVPGATVLTEQASTRLNGWYIGGGLEWAISPGWTTGIEYRHYEFGSNSATSNSACTSAVAGCPFGAGVNIGTPLERLRFDDTTDTISARVSWRWGRPEAAPLK
jgi:outer membrane immunogenic protein